MSGNCPSGLYAYYLAASDGVTHRVLNNAENSARRVLVALDRLDAFAKEKKLSLVYGQIFEKSFPFFLSTSSSVIDKSVIPIREHMWSSRYSPLIYLPSAGQSLKIEWANAVRLLDQMQDNLNIEATIVAAAQKERVPCASSAEDAVLLVGSNLEIRSEAYKVFAEWIYRVPVDRATDKRFIPPQSQEISLRELNALTTSGFELNDFRSEYRKIRHVLAALPQVNAVSALGFGG